MQIDIKIICDNCEYDHGQVYYNQMPTISIESMMPDFKECEHLQCGIEICDSCSFECDKCYSVFCDNHKNDHDCEVQ